MTSDNLSSKSDQIYNAYLRTVGIEKQRLASLTLPLMYLITLMITLPATYSLEGDNTIFQFWSTVLAMTILNVGELVSNLQNPVEIYDRRY